MVKQIGQVLIVTWVGGKVTKHRRSGWAEFVDMRTKYENNPNVRDTEVQYEV